jgi:benzoyl-CoA reductase/2-hydroxyglutaryl-CoA dehydratase subunit BcrC/BadD/HgdB
MTFENPTETDPRLLLDRENKKRLQELMGDKYEPIEMDDYLSYVSPEDAQKEIDGFEQRLKKGRQDPEQIMEEFKKHLSYVYAAR